jgi:hypothetical protein
MRERSAEAPRATAEDAVDDLAFVARAVHVLTAEGVYIRSDRGAFMLPGAHARALAQRLWPALSAGHAPKSLLQSLSERDRAVARPFFKTLAGLGVLRAESRAASGAPAPVHAAAETLLAGPGRAASWLKSLSTPAPARILACASRADWQAAALRPVRTAWLGLAWRGLFVLGFVGTERREAPCVGCLIQQLADAAEWGARLDADPPPWAERLGRAWLAAALASAATSAWPARPQATLFDAERRSTASRTIERHPRCHCCFRGESIDNRATLDAVAALQFVVLPRVPGDTDRGSAATAGNDPLLDIAVEPPEALGALVELCEDDEDQVPLCRSYAVLRVHPTAELAEHATARQSALAYGDARRLALRAAMLRGVERELATRSDCLAIALPSLMPVEWVADQPATFRGLGLGTSHAALVEDAALSAAVNFVERALRHGDVLGEDLQAPEASAVDASIARYQRLLERHGLQCRCHCVGSLFGLRLFVVRVHDEGFVVGRGLTPIESHRDALRQAAAFVHARASGATPDEPMRVVAVGGPSQFVAGAARLAPATGIGLMAALRTAHTVLRVARPLFVGGRRFVGGELAIPLAPGDRP